MMQTRAVFASMCAIVLVSLAACAPAARQAGPIVYPDAPEEPRLVYLASYQGLYDFREPSFFDRIFGAPVSTMLRKPYGVTEADGKIFVTVTSNPSVVVFDLKAKTVTTFGDSGFGRLTMPIGIAVGPDGRVYVSDSEKKAIFVYNEKGDLKGTFGQKDGLRRPSGLAIDSNLRRLYVADSYSHAIMVYSLEGKKLFQFGSDGQGDGQFHFPTNIAVDRKTGNLYVVDTQNFRVQVFDKEGKFLSKFGSIGDGMGNFARPKGIGIDSEGHIYVADAAFSNFQVFDRQGRLLLFIGHAGLRPGFFNLPAGLYVDEEDKVYVADSLNNRIQVFQFLSDRWKQEHPEEYRKYIMPSMEAGK